MKVNTNKVRFEKNQQEAYTFLLDMKKNYEQLMPEDTKSFEIHESEGFTVGVGALPKVGMRLKETVEPSKIVFRISCTCF